jgi:hypothetical protein
MPGHVVDRVRWRPHPWCLNAAAGAFALGWLTTALILFNDRGSTGTGFGNLGILILGVMVGVAAFGLGLVMAIFRGTRDPGTILASGGGAYAIGIVFGFFVAMVW